MNHGDANTAGNSSTARRSFLMRFGALVLAGIVALFPVAAGLGVIFDPLRRKRNVDGGDDGSEMAGFVRICPLESLPADGVPHEFAVTTDISDAWTRAVAQRIGSVFISRTDSDGKPQLTAFTAACPHLGCAVEFDAQAGRFKCPCHESAFSKDGQKLFGPSLRGLDPLAVEIAGNTGTEEVWVKFQRFQAGVAERKPVG